MRRGRLGETKGPMRRGPTTFMRLSLTGDAKMGPGGGPASRWGKDHPSGGGRRRKIEAPSDQRDLPAWAAETGKDAQV
jgi:hypothetical protein